MDNEMKTGTEQYIPRFTPREFCREMHGVPYERKEEDSYGWGLDG